MRQAGNFLMHSEVQQIPTKGWGCPPVNFAALTFQYMNNNDKYQKNLCPPVIQNQEFTFAAYQLTKLSEITFLCIILSVHESQVWVLDTCLTEKFYRILYSGRKPSNHGYKCMQKWASKLYRKKKLVFIRPSDKVGKKQRNVIICYFVSSYFEIIYIEL